MRHYDQTPSQPAAILPPLMGNARLESAVSDSGTLRGLAQFNGRSQPTGVCKHLNPNRIEERRDLKEGFALHCSGLLASD